MGKKNLNQQLAITSSRTYRSGIRRDGAGNEHHVEGDDDLDDEGVPVRPRRRGGADHIDGVQHRLEHERRAHRPSELRRPVERHLRKNSTAISVRLASASQSRASGHLIGRPAN
jgi:hypothetical protein